MGQLGAQGEAGGGVRAWPWGWREQMGTDQLLSSHVADDSLTGPQLCVRKRAPKAQMDEVGLDGGQGRENHSVRQ